MLRYLWRLIVGLPLDYAAIIRINGDLQDRLSTVRHDRSVLDERLRAICDSLGCDDPADSQQALERIFLMRRRVKDAGLAIQATNTEKRKGIRYDG